MSERPRGTYVIGAMLAGAAVGLLIYRYGVLGLTWRGGARHVFTGLVIGLGFGANALMKGSHRPGLPLVAAFAAVGLGASMALAYTLVPTFERADLDLEEMPGFLIGMPDGEIADQHRDYTAGKVLMKNIGGGGVIGLEWETGTVSREEMEAMVRALGPTMQATGAPVFSTRLGPKRISLDSAALQTPKGKVVVTFIPCAERRVMVMTLGDEGMERVHDRMLSSFRCRPDPTRRQVPPGEVAVHLELPGWYVGEPSDREPMLVTITDGRAYLTVRQLAGGSPQDLPKVIPAALGVTGMKTTVGARVGDRLTFTGSLGDENVVGWAREIVCPKANVMLLLLAADEAVANEIAETTQHARCLRAGEAPPVWPDAPAAPAEAAPAPPAP